MSEVEKFDDILDTTDESEVAEPEVVVETAETETVETKEETTEVEETKEVETKEVTEESTTGSKEKSWTFSQAMDEREKRQKLGTENETLKKQLADLQPKEDKISVFSDEEGYEAQQAQERRQELWNTSLNMSEAFAEEAFGAEKVSKAKAWMETEGVKSPYVVNKFQSAKLPYHAAVKLYKAEQERLNPDAYRATLKAEILAEINGETKDEPEETITSSLATSRSSGDDKEIVPDFGDLLGN